PQHVGYSRPYSARIEKHRTGARFEKQHRSLRRPNRSPRKEKPWRHQPFRRPKTRSPRQQQRRQPWLLTAATATLRREGLKSKVPASPCSDASPERASTRSMKCIGNLVTLSLETKKARRFSSRKTLKFPPF